MITSALPALNRRGFLALSAAAVAVSATGCGFVNTGGGGGGGDKTAVSAAVSTEQAKAMKDLVPAFEKASGLSVDLTSAATPDLNEQLSVQLGSGTAPDVFRVSPGSSSAIGASLLGARGKLAKLTSQSWADKVPPASRSLAGDGTDIYALPLSQNELVMAYNKDVFTDAGVKPPTTFSELLTACGKLKAGGVTPISAGFTGGIYLQFIIYQLAASIVYAADPDIDAEQKGSKTAFSSSASWREVFTKFLKLQTEGYFTDGANGVSGDQALQAVASGKAAMIGMVSASLSSLFKATTSKSGIGTFALPGTDDASQTLLPVAPDFIAVNANASSVDNALKLVDFLAEPANAKAYAAANSSLAGLNIDAPVPDELSDVADLISKGRTAPFANYTWPNGDTQQTLLQSGQDLIAGKITVDELLHQLDVQFAKGTP